MICSEKSKRLNRVKNCAIKHRSGTYWLFFSGWTFQIEPTKHNVNCSRIECSTLQFSSLRMLQMTGALKWTISITCHERHAQHSLVNHIKLITTTTELDDFVKTCENDNGDTVTLTTSMWSRLLIFCGLSAIFCHISRRVSYNLRWKHCHFIMTAQKKE